MITPISDASAPASFDALAARIRQSSNFRFAWQWLCLEAMAAASADKARRILGEILVTPICHDFLRNSFDDMYDPTFEIGALHEHSTFVEATAEFEQTLARAASDRLGAYSRRLINAEASDVADIRQTLEPVAPYRAFLLTPGRAAGCASCKKHNGYLFTNWFYGVAWDWCFCLISQRLTAACVVCLTDTD